jgi:hypothetical protein
LHGRPEQQHFDEGEAGHLMVRTAACPDPRWNRHFVEQLLPAIVAHAKYAFRHLHGDERQDLIQETIANALVAFVALARRGKLDLAYGSVSCGRS